MRAKYGTPEYSEHLREKARALKSAKKVRRKAAKRRSREKDRKLAERRATAWLLYKKLQNYSAVTRVLNGLTDWSGPRSMPAVRLLIRSVIDRRASIKAKARGRSRRRKP